MTDKSEKRLPRQRVNTEALFLRTTGGILCVKAIEGRKNILEEPETSKRGLEAKVLEKNSTQVVKVIVILLSRRIRGGKVEEVKFL